MRLPRGVSGARLATLLGRFGYEVTRQTGSHLRLTSGSMEREHHVTVPAHRNLAVGTLAAVVGDVAAYLERSRREVAEELFGR